MNNQILMRAQAILNQNLGAQLAIPTDTNLNSNAALFAHIIADVTRKISYYYATIGSNGKINFHVSSIFKTVNDQRNNDPRYRDKRVWISVNTDPQVNPKNPEIHYDDNIAMYLHLMSPMTFHNGKNQPNFNNGLVMADPKIKQILIPSDIDAILQSPLNDKNQNAMLATLNEPFINLRAELAANASTEMSIKDRQRENIEAYKVYTQEVLSLVQQGLLTLSYALINPTANSITPSFQLEETMNASSNYYMNFKDVVTNSKAPINRIPKLNRYQAVIQITDADIGALDSNNAPMLGKRLLNENAANQTEEYQERYALSKVGVIKDYNSDQHILVSIIDRYTDNRSRVGALEALLDKGVNTFIMSGYLVPVVREIDSNSSRSGNIFFELNVDTYTVFNSQGLHKVMESDQFSDLGFDMDLDTSVDTSEMMQSVDLITDLNKPTGESQSSAGQDLI